MIAESGLRSVLKDDLAKPHEALDSVWFHSISHWGHRCECRQLVSKCIMQRTVRSAGSCQL